MYIVLFHSVSDALFLEKVTKNKPNFQCEIIPVPRELSSSCGYAIRVTTNDIAKLQHVMSDHDIEWEEIYSVEQETYLLI